MVAKIMKSAGSMKSPLDYNEEKVEKGDAHVVGTANMDGPDGDVHATFRRYETGNIRTKDVSFHMSVNPGPGERMTDAEARSFIGELMEGLGYGDQPFIIYRHNDIEREHYHVVSIRVKEDGRKVRDFLEGRNCLRLVGDLSEKYGFAVGNGPVHDRHEVPPVYIPGCSDARERMSAAAGLCCSFRFTQEDQFRLLMRACGVDVRTDGDTMKLSGIGLSGRRCTAPVSSARLDPDPAVLCRRRIAECQEHPLPESVQRSVAGTVYECLRCTHRREALTSMLEEDGIRLVTRKGGKDMLNDSLFIHKETKSVYTAADLSKALGKELGDVESAERQGHRNGKGEDVTVVETAETLSELIFSMGDGSSRSRDARQQDVRTTRRR